jgi:hypothetical protein
MTWNDFSSKESKLAAIAELLALLPDETVQVLADEWEQLALENGWLTEGWSSKAQYNVNTSEEAHN